MVIAIFNSLRLEHLVPLLLVRPQVPRAIPQVVLRVPVRVVPQVLPRVELPQVPVLQVPPLPRVPARGVLQELQVRAVLPRVLQELPAQVVLQALLLLVLTGLPLPLQSR